jgi:small-conductance mechanosensitive channel
MDIFERIDWNGILTRAVEFLPKLFLAALVMAAFWAGFKVSRRPVRSVFKRMRLEEALIQLLVDRIFRYSLLAFGLVMALAQLGVDVTAALAGIGVAGIAIGFAAQDSLSNVIAGFLIFMDKPFQVGDWVTVSGQYGMVREITMRTTRIRTNNNTYVVIPNKNIIDEVLINHSKHGATRIDVPLGIAYKEDILRAREVLLAAVGGLRDVAREPEPDVVVVDLGSSSVDLHIRVWIADAGREKPVFAAVIEAAKLALDAAGIEIPYPHLQLFVEQVEQRVWEKAAKLRAVDGE